MIAQFLLIILFSFLPSSYEYNPIDRSCNISNKHFPKSFRFGVSSSAYQSEGGWNEDGKGLSYMDYLYHTNCSNTTNSQQFHTFCNTTNSVDGKNGDVSGDSYHKWSEDIQLLKKLGIKFYRFSIAWTRILPDGTLHNINQAGIDHYLRFIKELKVNGIEPMVTLFHWDTPLNLHQLGGWLNPEISKHFGDYARICFTYFGEYVKIWITINEAHMFCTVFYEKMTEAGKGENIYQCGKNLLLAHATAYHIYHDKFADIQHGKISLVIDATTNIPATNSPVDLAATERANAFQLDWISHPVFIGDWPPIMKQRVYEQSMLQGYSVSRLPSFTAEELNFVNGTFDYFGLNTYNSILVSHTNDSSVVKSPSYSDDMAISTFVDPKWKSGVTSWLYSYPPGMQIVLKYIWTTYRPGEIYITENGWATAGALNDQDRIDYLQGYLSNVLESILDGVNVVGYSVWSFLDDFEWNIGYGQKFGLINVDFDSPNRTRTFRNSAYWYRKLCATHCLTDNCIN